MSLLRNYQASRTFLIEQARLVATDVNGVVIKGSGHWLMKEAPGQVIPQLATFLKDSKIAVSLRTVLVPYQRSEENDRCDRTEQTAHGVKFAPTFQ
ncbi:MAG TPA: hypothetical protein VI750_00545 [Pyrinomonadaceae bacterium]|nr:hypothetical protein [Pyrinomonadaceae bacterium]